MFALARSTLRGIGWSFTRGHVTKPLLVFSSIVQMRKPAPFTTLNISGTSSVDSFSYAPQFVSSAFVTISLLLCLPSPKQNGKKGKGALSTAHTLKKSKQTPRVLLSTEEEWDLSQHNGCLPFSGKLVPADEDYDGSAC